MVHKLAAKPGPIHFHVVIPVGGKNHSRASSPSLEARRPVLCAVVDSEDHDVSFIDGIGGDEGGIRNDQLTGARNPASSARHGESGKLLNAADNLHCDPGGNVLVVG